MLEPEILYRLHFVSDPEISRDGRLVAFVRARTEDEKPQKKDGEKPAGADAEPPKKVYRSKVWLSRDGGPAAPFTSGTARDTSPRFSPDGERLAFLSSRDENRPQLFVMPVGGGEARALTRLKSGASSPRWSPDGASVAFLSRGDWDDRRAERGEPREFERIQYKQNGVGGPGFAPDEPQQLWVVDAGGPEPEPRRVSEHPVDVDAFDWLPDGSGLVFSAAPDADARERWRSELFFQPVAGGAARRLTRWDGTLGSPAVSPDGSRVAALGSRTSPDEPGDPHVHAIRLGAGALEGEAALEPERLDEGLDLFAGNAVGGDSHLGGFPSAPVWTADGALLAMYTAGPSGVVYRLREGSAPELVRSEVGANLAAFAAAADGALAYVKETTSSLPDAFLWRGGTETRLSDASTESLAGVELAQGLEHLRLERDGYTVEGWLMRPLGWKEGERYPVVLEVHGGPATAYGHAFHLEFQLLAARGYAVLFSNIRGSVGYGEAQTRGNDGDYGAGDFADLMAFLDAALERHPWLDGSRAAVMGGSYGGFMTNWVTSHTDRFRAAVTDRSICNWLSFFGTSDIGYRFTPRELHGVVPQDLERLWERSPLKHVNSVSTPTLIIHAEEDHRCPIEQGEQWFVALRRLGVEARFVRFPFENHELSRSGRPDRRVRRLREILDWYQPRL
jgi:dipeptidyl aminopeptidase/acylaminoacyl peptidase